MQLEHVSTRGFRGIGSRLDIPLGYRTILYGPNGSGKTSILQAITWAIYGKPPLLSGTVFTREDALVNDFAHESRASVTVRFSDSATVTRDRNRQRSTTRGASTLTASFQGDDLQADVEGLVGLTLDEFFAAVFLHQETIRAFITSTPEERSGTIDRMLGTYLLRTLVKVADPRVPAAAIERAEECINNLNRQLSQASILSREVIQKRREEYGDPAALPQLLDAICLQIMSVTGKLRLPAPEPTVDSLETSLMEARRAQVDAISALESRSGELAALKERFRHAAITSWQAVEEQKRRWGDASRLPGLLQELHHELRPMAEALGCAVPENALEDLVRCLEEARGMQASATLECEKSAGQLEILRERMQQLSEEVVESTSVPPQLEEERSQVHGHLGMLRQELEALAAQSRERDLAEEEAARLRTDVQALPQVIRDIQELRRELDTLDAGAKQGSLHNQILAAGRELLNELRPNSCPLCNQRISDVEALLKRLRRETPADIDSMQRRSRVIRTDLAEKEMLASELERKQGRVSELEQKLSQSPHDLDAKIEQKEGTRRGLAGKLVGIEAEITRSEGRIRLAMQHQQRLESVRAEVAQALGRTPVEGFATALSQAILDARKRAAELQALTFQPIADKLDRAKQLRELQHAEKQLRQQLEAVTERVWEMVGKTPGASPGEALDEAIEGIRRQIAEIRALDIQSVAQQIEHAKQLNEIRKDEARLAQMESGYQTASQEKARQRSRIERLTGLRDALQDIAETTKRRQQEIVAGALSALDINRYYQRLDPHPAYRELQIEPELTGRGTYHYWIKALTEDRSHDTYVQTRFSTAQANCAAIAIFLAVNEHLSTRLDTLILDDPSQSMDLDHKKRLARTLAASSRQVIVATEDDQLYQLLADALENPTIHRFGSWTTTGASLLV